MKKLIALIIALFIFPSIIGETSINNFEDSEQQLPAREYVYHKYADMTLELQDLEENYPHIMKLTSIGQSVFGRELWNVHITNFADQTNIENRTKVYFDGAHHGDEPLSSETCLLLIHYLVENYNSDSYVTNILNNANIFITPMINPDGIDEDHRHNDRGVDLNRNYPFKWKPAIDHGSEPASEPEVASNIKFMEQHDFDLYITCHTGITYLIYPWGYCYDEAPDFALFHQIEKEVEEQYGIRVGQSSTSLYNASGTSKDYGYGERLIPSFTFEVDDEQTLPISVVSIPERLEVVFDVCLYLIDNTIKGNFQANLSVHNFEIPNVKEDEKFIITYNITNRGFANVTNATVTLNAEGVEILDNQTKIFSVEKLNNSEVNFTLKAKDEGDANIELIINYQKLEIENSTNLTLIDIRTVEIEDSGVVGNVLLIFFVIAVISFGCFYVYWKKKHEPL